MSGVALGVVGWIGPGGRGGGVLAGWMWGVARGVVGWIGPGVRVGVAIGVGVGVHSGGKVGTTTVLVGGPGGPARMRSIARFRTSAAIPPPRTRAARTRTARRTRLLGLCGLAGGEGCPLYFCV